jgi:hypothetical protein
LLLLLWQGIGVAVVVAAAGIVVVAAAVLKLSYEKKKFS